MDEPFTASARRLWDAIVDVSGGLAARDSEIVDMIIRAVIAEAKAEEREACLADIATEDKFSADRDCDDEVRLVRLIRARIRRRGSQ